ncbi:MAG: polysaccharide biosynthesis protein [Proteobacteria bacterium]|nr:polysaccharide biosynthesis protein [Pseudomonadota bacterium]
MAVRAFQLPVSYRSVGPGVVIDVRPLAVGLTFLTVVALFLLSGQTLNLIGVPYDAIGGNPLIKIHPASYLSMLALAVWIVADGGFGPFLARVWRESPGVLVLFLAIGFLTFQVIVVQKTPISQVTDNFVLTACLFVALVRLAPGEIKLLALVVQAILVVNSFLGYAEVLGGFRLTPLTVNGQVLTWDWRATALLGHPLMNAMATAVCLVSLALGAGPFRRTPRLMLVLFHFGALFFFGGRTAIVLSAAALVAITAFGAARLILGRRFPVTMAAAATLAVTILVIGAILAVDGGLIDRIIGHFPRHVLAGNSVWPECCCRQGNDAQDRHTTCHRECLCRLCCVLWRLRHGFLPDGTCGLLYRIGSTLRSAGPYAARHLLRDVDGDLFLFNQIAGARSSDDSHHHGFCLSSAVLQRDAAMLIRQTVLYLPAQFLSPVAQFLSMMIWTWWLSPTEMSTFVLVTSTQELAYMVSRSWFSFYTLRFLPPAEDANGRRRYLETETTLIVILTLPELAAAGLSMHFFDGRGNPLTVFLIIAAYYVTRGLNNHFGERARAQDKIFAYTLLLTSGPVGGLVAGLLVTRIFGASADGLLLAYAAMQALGTAVALPMIGASFRTARLDLVILKDAILNGGPMLAFNGIGWFGENGIRYVIDHIGGSAAFGLMAVGWGLGRRCASVASMLVAVAAFPIAARLINAGDRETALEQLKTSTSRSPKPTAT